MKQETIIIDGREVPITRYPMGYSGNPAFTSKENKDDEYEDDEDSEYEGLFTKEKDKVKIKIQNFADTGEYHGCEQIEDLIDSVGVDDIISLFNN